MFRIQENVPEYYVNNSRDFQLLCRAKDLVFGAVKYNIDSIRHVTTTLEMNSSLLPLLKSKLGFFAKENLSEEQLRYLLAGFPYLIKYKGSRKSLESAIYLWFRVNKLGGELISVDIDNESYSIQINIDIAPQNTELLDKLLQYLIPTGYIVKYNFANNTQVINKYKLQCYQCGVLVDSIKNANVRNKVVDRTVLIDNDVHTVPKEYMHSFLHKNIGSLDSTLITNKEEGATNVTNI